MIDLATEEIVPECFDVTYRGFRILKKRDFGTHGYWVPELRRNTREGYVVIYGPGMKTYIQHGRMTEPAVIEAGKHGCLATPGAGWHRFLEGARIDIDTMIECKIGQLDEDIDAYYRLFRERYDAAKGTA